jgi:hypothetical protein
MEEKFDVSLTLKAVGHQWYWEYQYALTDRDHGDLYFGFDSYMIADADVPFGGLRLLETDTTVLLPAYPLVGFTSCWCKNGCNSRPVKPG